MDAVGSAPQPHLIWPPIGPPFDQALRLAVEAVLAAYQPVGVIAAGSILRGQGGPTSDIDLYVIHRAPFRQRLQRRYAGVPFEIFVNPPQQVRRYFAEERRARQPITAHMLSTGFVVLDADPVVSELRRAAALEVAQPPDVDAGTQLLRSYLIVDLLDNARDVGAHFRKGLAGLMRKHALIGDVRGVGLATGVELVHDRTSKRPAGDVVPRLLNLIRDEGALVGGEGKSGNVLKIRPPIVFGRADADFAVSAIDRALARL